MTKIDANMSVNFFAVSIIFLNIIFFDEQMIGIHSKLLKKNARSISRRLKREKVKFKGKDIMDIMSTSVFYYIENKFVGNE